MRCERYLAFFLTLGILSSSGMLSACSSEDDEQNVQDKNQPGVAAAPEMIYPDGWTDFKMIANYAETSIDTLAHFTTSRNGCYKAEWGAIPLELWNQFATSLNAVIASPLVAEEICVTAPENATKYFDGNAEVKRLDGSKATVFENFGGKVCTKFNNKVAATDLANALHEIVRIADAENCTYFRDENQ